MSLANVDWFSDCVLIGADFSDTNLNRADFSSADLRESSLTNTTARGTDFTGANLEDAVGVHADFRRADFRQAKLDHMDIAGCNIDTRTTLELPIIYETELAHIDDAPGRKEKFGAALETYKTLEGLAEQNMLVADANRYYQQQKDLHRRFNWTTGNYLHAATAEISRVVTGYDIRSWRVIATSVSIILVAAALYPFVGIRTGGTVHSLPGILHADPGSVAMTLFQSLFFSTVTFTTLGYGNIEPIGVVAQSIAGVEAFLGALLMALLVAVFMKSTRLR